MNKANTYVPELDEFEKLILRHLRLSDASMLSQLLDTQLSVVHSYLVEYTQFQKKIFDLKLQTESERQKQTLTQAFDSYERSIIGALRDEKNRHD